MKNSMGKEEMRVGIGAGMIPVVILLIFLSSPCMNLYAGNEQAESSIQGKDTDQTNVKVENVFFTSVRGFYNKEFDLSLLCNTPGAEIRYTLNGSLPTLQSGRIYDSIITVGSTTIIRAAAFATGMDSSDVSTHTYIFPSEVIHQPPEPLYADSTAFALSWAGVSADYAMDPDVIQVEGQERMVNALLSVPSLTIVMNDDDLFQKIMNGGGKDSNDGLESPASMEMIYPKQSWKNFQVNCGFGPRSRNLESRAIKRGFEIMFKSEFGAPKLKYPIFSDAPRNRDNAVDKFDNLILRPGFCDTWSSVGYDDSQDTYTRDPMTREAYLDVTGVGTHNHFVHLYLNGLYWGLFNLTEKINENFLTDYLGGEDEDWLVVKSNTDSDDDGQVNNGDETRYQQLLDLIGGDEVHGPLQTLYSDADYKQVCTLIDPVRYAQYIMVHCYHGAGDWPDNNWYFIMLNNPPEPGFFQIWDAEKSLASYGNDGRKHAWYTPLLTEIGTRGGRAVPSRLWKAMLTNPDFKMVFADQVYRNIIKSDGTLSNENSLLRWTELNDFIGASDMEHAAIIGESGRWGDSNIDNTIIAPALYNDWISPVQEAKIYLQSNATIFYEEFKSVLDQPLAPRIRINNKIENGSSITLEDAFEVSLENQNPGGSIYFRTDGLDPRIYGGSLRGEVREGTPVYSTALEFNGIVNLRSRVLFNGEWSPLNFLDIYNPNALHANLLDIDYQVYPNPFHESIYLKVPFNHAERLRVELFTLSGQEVYTDIIDPVDNSIVKLESGILEKGSYLFILKSSDGTVVNRKILIKAE